MIRIFNDGGDQGTTGAAIELFWPENALNVGDSTVCSRQPTRRRSGSTSACAHSVLLLSIVVQKAQGATVKTVTRQFPSQYFVRMTDAQFTDSARQNGVTRSVV